MNRVVIASLAVVALFATSTAYADCACKVAKVENGWCADCSAGYVAGVKIKSRKLYDALDGKTIKDASAIKCKACKTGLTNNGECKHCQVAFAGGKAFHSKPACCVSRGKAVETSAIKCESCKANFGGKGWCEGCKAGLVGNRVYADKAAYKEALMGREIIQKAAKVAEKCEGCAVAMVTDGECKGCKVSFKQGKALKAMKPATP